MSKFVSKIDGKVFETKEELMNHLESTYIHEETDEDSTYADILFKLKESFPEESIQITKCNDGSYYVELTFDLGASNETFTFTIEGRDSSNTDEFLNVDEAIKFYTNYPKQTKLIRETLSNRYNLESFEVNQWVVAGEWDDFGHHICLDVKLNGIEMYLESGINQDIEDFIQKEVEINFKTEFEGNVSQSYEGWFVGDASLYRILNRANKVKITILE